MTESFRAFRIHESNGGIRAALERLTLADLGAGDVVIRVTYSSINYKDALAATGAGSILRRFPLVGGIDLAGTVLESDDARFAPGDEVLVCGCGLGETHDGGYAEIARVPGDWVVPMPPGLDARRAMAIGTAGLTAALAIHRLERNGQHPALGPILVTGATGGVGSIAIDLLSGRGYETVALTGKPDAHAYLESLGAARIVDRRGLELAGKPLGPATWGGGVDAVGGDVLAWLIRTTRANGNIASIGLAGGAALATTVLPFILRGVSLLGINSVSIEPGLRADLWTRLGAAHAPRNLDRIAAREVSLDELPGAFRALLDGAVVGRVIVRVAGSS
ncbi:MAG TPA: acryloyl-CoA reductase [Gammaproteobacteria bacterium]